jgi:predicted enzyme related to lactoylglutathione lyase
MSTPDGWAVYFATDDAQKTVDVAVANGARVVVPPMQVDDLGTMAVLTDVGGAVVGLWQPGRTRFRTVGEPGTPSWFELSTRDYEASIDFYCNLFSLGKQVVSDGPEMRYTVLTSGEEQVVGIMDATAMLRRAYHRTGRCTSACRTPRRRCAPRRRSAAPC